MLLICLKIIKIRQVNLIVKNGLLIKDGLVHAGP